MDETKKYKVVEEVTIDDVVHAEGDEVELTDEKAAELGASVELVEEGEAKDEGSDDEV